jgi:alpha-1,3-mannosyltransferase
VKWAVQVLAWHVAAKKETETETETEVDNKTRRRLSRDRSADDQKASAKPQSLTSQMEGDLFYPIDNPWWWPSDAILSTSPASKAKFDTLSPFQVFAAWNGMVVLNPAPFTQHGVHFRRGSKTRGECAASECGLLASDFWKTNYGRVQVVPAVQLAYDRPTAFASAARLREEMVRLGWENGVPPATFDKAVSFAKT